MSTHLFRKAVRNRIDYFSWKGPTAIICIWLLQGWAETSLEELSYDTSRVSCPRWDDKGTGFLEAFVVSSPDLGRRLQVHSSTMRNAFYVFPLNLQKGGFRGGLDEICAISNHPCGALSQLGLRGGNECRSVLKCKH